MASSGLSPPKPNDCDATSRSALRPFTTDALIDAVNDEKKIVMTDTSMSVSTIAAAVADVRRGFRVALSRAIRPVRPATLGSRAADGRR